MCRRSPTLEADDAPQLGAGAPPAVGRRSNQRSSDAGGAVRASSVGEAPSRARSITRAVDVGPEHLDARRRRGSRADRGERVALRAVRAAGAPDAQMRPPARELGQHRASPRSAHCSGFRQSCETLIVMRSRKAFELLRVLRDERRRYSSRSAMPAPLGERADAPLHLGALVLAEVDAGQPLGRPRRERGSRRLRPRRAGGSAARSCRTRFRGDRLGQLVERQHARRRGPPRRSPAASRRPCRSTRPRRGCDRRGGGPPARPRGRPCPCR